MDFLSNLAKTATQPKPEGGADNQQSTTDLFASAKVVAEAAQAQFNNQPEKYDKAKVAGATADILDAAKDYGKLDESQGIGKYVEQAETYLRQYDTTTTTTTTNEPNKAEPEAAMTEPEAPKPTETTDDEPNKTSTDVTKPAVDEPTEEEPKKIVEDTKPETKEELATTTEETVEPTETTEAPKPSEPAAADDYVKMAEGFLNKASTGDEKSTGNDYMKMAEGLLSKAAASGGGGDGEKKDEAAGGVGNVMKMAGGFFSK